MIDIDSRGPGDLLCRLNCVRSSGSAFSCRPVKPPCKCAMLLGCLLPSGWHGCRIQLSGRAVGAPTSACRRLEPALCQGATESRILSCQSLRLGERALQIPGGLELARGVFPTMHPGLCDLLNPELQHGKQFTSVATQRSALSALAVHPCLCRKSGCRAARDQ